MRRALKSATVAVGLAARDQRARRWQDDDATIGTALHLVDWKAMLKAPGLTPQDTEFWHKLRLHQLYSWRSEDQEAPCARSECRSDDNGTTGHIFWRCPDSEAVWSAMLQRWGRPPASAAELQTEIFGWRTPPTDFDWKEVVAAHPDIDPADLVTATARYLWGDHVAQTLNEDAPVPQDRTTAILARWKHRLGVIRVWAASRGSARLDHLILRCLARRCAGDIDSIPRVSLSENRYLLFFDGGSRGNPGPGGSGSVILRVRDGIDMIWVAAMSYASTKTTNNFAEFQGLVTGLLAAVANNWHPLTVIGDSNIILSVMRRKKAPKAVALRPLFHQARQAAASLRVTGWHHHYRAQNKMADKAANIAMDARRSFQAFAQDPRPEVEIIRALIHHDVAPWTTRLLLSPLSPDRPAGS